MDNATTIVLAIIGSGAFSTVVNAICNYYSDKRKDKDGVQSAIRLLLKDQLRYLCMRCIKQSWIYEDELDDLITMHRVYHDGLGGNGYLDTLLGKVKALEVRRREA